MRKNLFGVLLIFLVGGGCDPDPAQEHCPYREMEAVVDAMLAKRPGILRLNTSKPGPWHCPQPSLLSRINS